MQTDHHLARMDDTPPATCMFCDEPAQSEHTPCCNSHGKALCCVHYCRAHFVEVDQCDPATHSRARA